MKWIDSWTLFAARVAYRFPHAFERSKGAADSTLRNYGYASGTSIHVCSAVILKMNVPVNARRGVPAVPCSPRAAYFATLMISHIQLLTSSRHSLNFGGQATFSAVVRANDHLEPPTSMATTG